MNNQKINTHRLKFYLALVIVFGLFFASTHSWGHSNCQSYEEQLTLSGQTPFGIFNGGATVSFDGNAPEPAIAGSVLMGSADFDPANPGPILFKRAGELLFAPGIDGSVNALTAKVRVTGTPTGPGTFNLLGRIRFTGGTGKFEHAHGKAKLNGTATVDLMTGFAQLNATLKGKICNVKN